MRSEAEIRDCRAECHTEIAECFRELADIFHTPEDWKEDEIGDAHQLAETLAGLLDELDVLNQVLGDLA